MSQNKHLRENYMKIGLWFQRFSNSRRDFERYSKL